jgi:predicted DNA-binding transcriptional regulator YafY
MSKKQFIKRHLLILGKLRKNPCDFKELQGYLKSQSLDDEENYEISKRTFERDVKEISSIFNVEIQYNRKEKVYEIIHDADDNKTSRLIESFQMYNALSMSESIAKHLILEKRKSLGLENLHGLLHAIQNRVSVSYQYENFWDFDNKKNIRFVFPLALKEARYHWYLIAKDTNDGNIKSFGLDRISYLEISANRFEYPTEFNVEEKFKHAFGIINGEEAPEKIKLWFTRGQGNYIKSLPLHVSQKIISENDTELILELFVCPSHDFVMELLSMGAAVKVLEPLSLQQKIKAKLLDAAKLYK